MTTNPLTPQIVDKTPQVNMSSIDYWVSRRNQDVYEEMTAIQLITILANVIGDIAEREENDD